MRKLLGLSLVVCAALSMLIASSAEAISTPSIPTVKICRICPRGSWELPNGTVVFRGWVTEVTLRALRGHLRQGSMLLDDSATVGACCAFRVLPDGTMLPGVD